MAKFADHDSYIAAAPEQFRPLLVRLRWQLAQALPDAEEVIMYDMPGFGFGKTIIASYAAFSRQCGVYVSKGAIAAHGDEIEAAGLKATKTGITFLPRNPVSQALLTKLALASRKDVGLTVPGNPGAVQSEATNKKAGPKTGLFQLMSRK